MAVFLFIYVKELVECLTNPDMHENIILLDPKYHQIWVQSEMFLLKNMSWWLAERLPNFRSKTGEIVP